MDNKFFDAVIAEMKDILNEANLTVDGDVFKNENKAVKVEYIEARQMYTLAIADVIDGNIGEYAEISAWLFDDTQNAKDAACVGMDFADTLRKNLGIAVKKVAVNSIVDLPTIKKGDEVNINGFTKKMLDIFPALKDEYKKHVGLYGNLLYLNFFGDHLVSRIVRLFEEGTPKQIKKFYDVAKDFYIQGDNDTSNTVLAVLAAAAYVKPEISEKIKETLKQHTHFYVSYVNFVSYFNKNKKLISALVKK